MTLPIFDFRFLIPEQAQSLPIAHWLLLKSQIADRKSKSNKRENL
jgi:hypothetical protein